MHRSLHTYTCSARTLLNTCTLRARLNLCISCAVVAGLALRRCSMCTAPGCCTAHMTRSLCTGRRRLGSFTTSSTLWRSGGLIDGLVGLLASFWLAHVLDGGRSSLRVCEALVALRKGLQARDTLPTTGEDLHTPPHPHRTLFPTLRIPLLPAP